MWRHLVPTMHTATKIRRPRPNLEPVFGLSVPGNGRNMVAGPEEDQLCV